MNRIIVSFVTLFFAFSTLTGQTAQQLYLEYIKRYSDLAVEQQKLHRIPASITLAQGILESIAGVSELARVSNNHFGIKCTSDWKGEGVYQRDDKDSECFRKYNTVRESFEDHSMFLKNRTRYAALFELEPTDYKGWANGLQRAGYATDPGYGAKLIRLIENYDLHRFDGNKEYDGNIRENDADRPIAEPEQGKIAATSLKGHQLYRNNGVLCVFAEAGDTYSSIANEFRITPNKILIYNDLSEIKPLEPGNVVYLGKKKDRASKEFTAHQVREGESMFFIAQKYAMKLQKLYDLNNKPYWQAANVGNVLMLK